MAELAPNTSLGTSDANANQSAIVNAQHQRDAALDAARQLVSQLPPGLAINLQAKIAELAALPLTAMNIGTINNLIAELARESTEARENAAADMQRNAMEAMVLSAEAQARVASNVSALREGRVADYYFNNFDPNHEFSDEARRVLAQAINSNPEIKANAEAVQHIEPGRHRAIEGDRAQFDDYVQQQIAASSGATREEWEKIDRLKLGFSPALRDKLKNATPETLHALVEEGIAERANLAKPVLDQFNANTPEGAILRKFHSQDGYGFSDEAAAEIIALGSSQSARAAYSKAIKHGYASLTPEEQHQAAAAKVAALADADYGMQTTFMEVLKREHDEKHVGEQGHEGHFAAIMNNSLPDADRIKALVEETLEHGGPNGGPMADQSDRARRKLERDAKRYIETLKQLPDPEASVLGKEGHNYRADMQRAQAHRLLDGAYSKEQVDALVNFAGTNPQTSNQLEVALRTLNNERPSMAETREAMNAMLGNAINVVTNPAYADALSRIRYYNLLDTNEGQQLLSFALGGTMNALDAGAVVGRLQAETLSHMQSFAGVVPSMISDDYRTRLQTLGMLQPDGSFNVEKLIEQARINRDKLGDSDAAIAARSNMSWEELTEAQRDVRVIAQAAARFKAIEAIQGIGRDINAAYERVGGNAALASSTLQDDLKQYSRMINEDGSYTAEEQRTAIDSLLQRQQYLRVNDTLRAEVVKNIVELSRTNPELLRSSEIFAAENTSYETVETPENSTMPEIPVQQTTAFTAQEIKTLNKEGELNTGDAIFENKLEDRLKKAFTGKEMAEIVATLGSVMGSSNVGRQDYVSVNEVENAMIAAALQRDPNLKDDAKVFAAADTNHDNKLDMDELRSWLTNAQVSAPQNVVATDPLPPPASTPTAPTPQLAQAASKPAVPTR